NTFTILDDFKAAPAPLILPPDAWAQIVGDGYRSALIVRLRAHEQRVSLQFWSKRPRAFEPQQVPVARRVADHVALAVSHEQIAEAAREAAEARLRAERLEARVRSLSNELAARTGHGRMVGTSDQWQATIRAATKVAGTDTTVLL